MYNIILNVIISDMLYLMTYKRSQQHVKMSEEKVPLMNEVGQVAQSPPQYVVKYHRLIWLAN